MTKRLGKNLPGRFVHLVGKLHQSIDTNALSILDTTDDLVT